jgi:hypothetical protein
MRLPEMPPTGTGSPRSPGMMLLAMDRRLTVPFVHLSPPTLAQAGPVARKYRHSPRCHCGSTQRDPAWIRLAIFARRTPFQHRPAFLPASALPALREVLPYPRQERPRSSCPAHRRALRRCFADLVSAACPPQGGFDSRLPEDWLSGHLLTVLKDLKTLRLYCHYPIPVAVLPKP